MARTTIIPYDRTIIANDGVRTPLLSIPSSYTPSYSSGAYIPPPTYSPVPTYSSVPKPPPTYSPVPTKSPVLTSPPIKPFVSAATLNDDAELNDNTGFGDIPDYGVNTASILPTNLSTKTMLMIGGALVASFVIFKIIKK